jgi:RNA polymerase sigma factor (sigma-70 family)
MLRAAAEEANPGDNYADESEKLGDRQAFNRVLAKLSAEQRAAITMFYLKDMSVAEIAVSLDIPAGTVKTRLMSARAKMRAALQGEKNGQA